MYLCFLSGEYARVNHGDANVKTNGRRYLRKMNVGQFALALRYAGIKILDDVS